MPPENSRWAAPPWAWALRAVLALSLVGYAVTFLPGVRGDGPAFSALMDIGLGDGILVLAAVACLARAWWDPAHRLAWALLGAGPLAYAAGDLYY
jgi:hypothetical protein